MRRTIRVLGTLMVAAGTLTLAWALLVWRWEDPFSALYTHFAQQHLASKYEQRVAAYRPRPYGAGLAAVRQAIAVDARDYRRSLHEGDPVGRLEIGRIGLNMIVVQGTDHETLKKGPGHYVTTGLPGENRLIYIAGHRTTYLAPFSHIDAIRPGDYVTFELPYATLKYRVTRHYVVAHDDTSVLVNRGREVLRLQACHPRFFATNRYIVDARLDSIEPRGGPVLTLPVARIAAAAGATAASS